MTLRATINQQVQIGLEASGALGVPVPANKLLEAFDWTLGDKAATKQFRASGRRYSAASELLTEMGSGKLKGPLCYNSVAYIWASKFGLPTIAAHGASSVAYDLTWTPKIQGANVPQTLTIQQGEPGVANGEQYAYGLVTGDAYEVSRKSDVTLSADLMSQAPTTGITLTASPTAIAVVPAVGKHFSLYVDTTSAGLGTTQLLNPMKFGPSSSGYYGEFWAVNRAVAGFSSHVDTVPKSSYKLQLEADTQGWSLRSELTAGSRVYLRESAIGPVLDSVNSINYALQRDYCFFVTSVADLADVDGVYAIEWTLEAAEDTAWGSGQAQKIMLTNSLPSL